jgi:murein DD-endopeptidase MepM/ murein hydrolase activator NlpD
VLTGCLAGGGLIVTLIQPAHSQYAVPEAEAAPFPAQIGAALGSGSTGTDTATGADADKGRRFWVRDKHKYRSPWYAGKHRKMINFGCTRAPYYDPSPLCIKDRGFHHGLDIAMRCGNKLYAGMRGRVVNPSSAGSLGSAYGPHAFRIRNKQVDRDFVIGHVRKVFVEPGDRVKRGQLIAKASDAGAPDGCHLHFEARPKKGSYTSAVKPHKYLKLRR